MGINDQDYDGLSDFCEKELLAAFSPTLNINKWDFSGREPYQVARPNGGIDRVLLGYLLAYYRDEGNSSLGCDVFNFLTSSCDGHLGDSEAIFLLVRYEEDIQHWILDEAYLSNHTGYKVVRVPPSNELDVDDLVYDGPHRGYPTIWVADSKHANYESDAACDGGGSGGSDECSGIRIKTRDLTGPQWNLGSNAHRLSNCVESRDPSWTYYGAGRFECFWTSSFFAGWYPNDESGARASPYKDRLAVFAF